MPFAPEFDVDDGELQLLEVPLDPEPSTGGWATAVDTPEPVRSEDVPAATFDREGDSLESPDVPEFTDADVPSDLDLDRGTFPPLDARDRPQAPPEDGAAVEAPPPWARPDPRDRA
jgi:hypothetical protein